MVRAATAPHAVTKNRRFDRPTRRFQLAPVASGGTILDRRHLRGRVVYITVFSIAGGDFSRRNDAGRWVIHWKHRGGGWTAMFLDVGIVRIRPPLQDAAALPPHCGIGTVKQIRSLAVVILKDIRPIAPMPAYALPVRE